VVIALQRELDGDIAMDSNNAINDALRDKSPKSVQELTATAWEMKTFYVAARENLTHEAFALLIEKAKLKVGV
jgi:hypothetical protein